MKKILCTILVLVAVILPAAPSTLAADAGETTPQGGIPTTFVLSCTTVTILLPKLSGNEYMLYWNRLNREHCSGGSTTPNPGEDLNESEDEVAASTTEPDTPPMP